MLPRVRTLLPWLVLSVATLAAFWLFRFASTRVHLAVTTPQFPSTTTTNPNADSDKSGWLPDVPIPRHIWQIFFPPPGADVLEQQALHASEWVSLAPGYTYTMLGAPAADAFLRDSFPRRPEIAATYHALSNPALKSDFLRYLLLLARGGTYSDVDTKPVVRLEDWLPAPRRRDVRLVVAVEYDEAQDPHPDDFQYPVQFCQWTIAAAPDHVVLARMVDRALAGLQDIATAQGTTLDKAHITDFNVLNATGPVAWTEVVFETLRERAPEITGYADLARIDAPRYFGDIVVLPLESFRADYLDDWGVSWRKKRRPLVRHFFKGAWKTSQTGARA